MVYIKITPKQAFKLKELLFIVLYWVTLVRIVVAFQYFGLNPGGVILTDSNAFQILRENMIAGTSAGFLIGLFTGLSELFFFQRYFRNQPIGKLMLAKLLVYSVWLVMITFFTLLAYYTIAKEKDILDAVSSALIMFTTNGFYHLFVTGFLLSMGINFILLMKSKIGHSIFVPILFGKFHKPREEERIFLFIDLKSSTKMAEQLGHEKYSQLIQDCFLDLSDLVIQYRGSVYQFVGDEAVISWKTKRKDNYTNSVNLFFAYQQRLIQKCEFYRRKYNVVPSFKGSLNAGKVMVAEVGGSVKSEIAYHGDVLNSASRMMELCKLYQKDLILPESFVEQISPIEFGLEIEFQAELLLRGKNKKMKIYSCSEIDNQLKLEE